MPARVTGRYVEAAMGESRFRAFVPFPLPPQPPLDLAREDLLARKERADQALGRLDGITQMLPDPTLFLYQYVRKRCCPRRSKGPRARWPICCCSSWTKPRACPSTTSRRFPTTSPRSTTGCVGFVRMISRSRFDCCGRCMRYCCKAGGGRTRTLASSAAHRFGSEAGRRRSRLSCRHRRTNWTSASPTSSDSCMRMRPLRRPW